MPSVVDESGHPMSDWIPVEELARLSRRGQRTLYNDFSGGRGPFKEILTKLGGRLGCWRADYEALVAQQHRFPPGPSAIASDRAPMLGPEKRLARTPPRRRLLLNRSPEYPPVLAESSSQASDIVTLAEAARVLKVSLRTLSKLVISGRLKSFQIGRCRRISRRALNDFIREGEAKAREK